MTVSKTTTTKYFEQELAKQNAAYEIAARLLSTFPEAGNIFTETGLAEVMRKILDKHLPGTAELQKENARLKEALGKIVPYCGLTETECEIKDCPSKIARAALSKEKAK